MLLPLHKITGVKNWTFPLNADLLKYLFTVPSHKLQAFRKGTDGTKISATDFDALYWFVLSKMKEQGVQFFSPGGSHNRRFCYWFNSHFWLDTELDLNINIAVKWFDKICELVIGNLKLPVELNDCEEVIITDSAELSQQGKDLILRVEPFTSFKGTIVFS